MEWSSMTNGILSNQHAERCAMNEIASQTDHVNMTSEDLDRKMETTAMREKTLISVEDREKLVRLYKAAQEILKGKSIKVQVDGVDKTLDPMNLAVGDALTLLETVESRAMHFSKVPGTNILHFGSSTTDSNVTKDLKTTKEIMEALDYATKREPGFIVKDGNHFYSIQQVTEGQEPKGFYYYVEIINRVEDETFRMWFEVLKDAKIIKNSEEIDAFLHSNSKMVHEWLIATLKAVSPTSTVLSNRFARSV